MSSPIRIRVEADGARAAGRDIDNLSTRTSRLSSGLKTLGKAALLGLGVGLVGAAAGAVKFAQAAIEDEQAAARMAQTFKTAAGATRGQIAATEDWITAQGKALGVADDDLRPALARLVTATGDVGKAQKLASLAMNVSAGTGKSLEQVSTALMKAQNGQVSSLSRLGINTKNAAGETITMEQATKRMADTFGGAAEKNANTLGGRIERLKLMASETGETIGAKMLPYVEQFATFVTDKAVPAFADFIDGMRNGTGAGGKLAAVFSTLKNNIGTIAPALGVVVAGMAAYKVATLASAAATAIQTAGTAGATGATWSLNAALRANPIGIVITLLTALGVGLVVAYKKSETFRSVVTAALDGVKTGFDLLGRAGVWLWNNALQPTFKFIVGGVASILDMWSSMLSVLGKVPGFGWAKDAADAMAAAADKANAMAEGIKKIPPRKDVTVAVKYTYSGLRGPGGSGPTRGRDDDFLGRTVAQTSALGYDLGKGAGRGFESGLDNMRGKVGDAADKVGKKVVEAIRNRLDKARELRDSVLSLRDSIAGALTGDLFGGTGDESGTALDKFRAAVAAAKATADQVLQATKSLISKGVSKEFLDKLMASGNTELIVQLGGAQDAAQLAKAYQGVIATNEQSGRLVAEEVVGVRLDSIGKTIRELMAQLTQRDKENRQRERNVTVRLTSEQRSQLERGREIRLDLDLWDNSGGRQVA